MITRGKLNPTVIHISYLAGVIDSDGCILISKMQPGRKTRTTNPRYVLSIVVTNTSLILMEWLVINFGGRYKARQRVSEKHKYTYNWYYDNGKAAEILKLIKPYLVVKSEQALAGIEFIENWELPAKLGQGAKTPPREMERREQFYQKMKRLNQTGNTAATTNSFGSCSV